MEKQIRICLRLNSCSDSLSDVFSQVKRFLNIVQNSPLNPGLFVNGWLHVAVILIKHWLWRRDAAGSDANRH
jgi:hypothetical protein